jgi:tRNA pseudouridine55 synthase
MIQKVLKLYKETSETPLECLERFRRENPEYKDLPMTYAGRLDPMAEGLLLVLAGGECKKKNEYLAFDKEYEGEILFGFSTDTGDILGLPNKEEKVKTRNEKEDSNSRILSNSRIAAEGLLGKRSQVYPAFSSKTVDGKPLWQWARDGEEVEAPKKEVEVFSFEILECRKESYSDILENVRMFVSKVGGDFRQEEILDEWKEVLTPLEDEAVICRFKTKVSSGTYIRALAEELGQKIGEPAVLYSLKRTKVGDFEIE